ncbi:hypothetical protein A3Q29_11230 [Providencia stuartii]|uniref:Uncharacterized protein n=1 Tax=Providencia stuartii TaxID=588 RepID=A0A1S1HPU1_PROST|nr:hypothetical protein A3Q29_11230 [Providencia stuartii]
MSDKKEIATLSIKISVDSADLDKLEGQLKRIEGLMVSAGLKQQAKQGFTADIGVFNPKGCLEPVFTVSSGVAYINEACIEKATLEKVMLQAAKEGAKKGAEQARAEITAGVNYDRKQLSVGAKLDDTEREIKETDAAGVLNGISEALHNSGNKAVIAALDKTIDINPSVSRNEFEEYKKQVEARFDELQSQLTHTQCALANNEQAAAQQLSDLQHQITELGKEIEEAKLKGSLNAISIISIKQTMEQQEKSLAETIKRTIVGDLCRGGTLSRTL